MRKKKPGAAGWVTRRLRKTAVVGYVGKKPPWYSPEE
jgi:hypothetical protein